MREFKSKIENHDDSHVNRMIQLEIAVEVRTTVVGRKTRAAAAKTAAASDEAGGGGPNRPSFRRRKNANAPTLSIVLKDHEIYDDISYFRRVLFFPFFYSDDLGE